MKSALKTIIFFQPEDTFLSLNIFRSSFSPNRESDTIYIPCKDGNVKYKHINDKDIYIEEQRGNTYFALKPIQVPIGQNHFSTMYSGLLATTSDSRCKYIYHLHDRFENVQSFYDVVSPDNISIHETNIYRDKDSALIDLRSWIKLFEEEGNYYMADGTKIPYNEIESHCNIVPLN